MFEQFKQKFEAAGQFNKDLEHILEIIDDMYGEEGFEDI